MRGEKGSERGRVVLCKLWRRDRQRTCARRALNCGIVEATTGKTRGHQVPKRPNTPCAPAGSEEGGWVGWRRGA